EAQTDEPARPSARLEAEIVPADERDVSSESQPTQQIEREAAAPGSVEVPDTSSGAGVEITRRPELTGCREAPRAAKRYGDRNLRDVADRNVRDARADDDPAGRSDRIGHEFADRDRRAHCNRDRDACSRRLIGAGRR